MILRKRSEVAAFMGMDYHSIRWWEAKRGWPGYPVDSEAVLAFRDTLRRYDRNRRPPETQYRLGQRIRRSRLQARLNQKELCERAGFCRSYVSAIEHGHIKPSIDRLMRIARALDVNAEWLRTGMRELRHSNEGDEVLGLA